MNPNITIPDRILIFPLLFLYFLSSVLILAFQLLTVRAFVMIPLCSLFQRFSVSAFQRLTFIFLLSAFYFLLFIELLSHFQLLFDLPSQFHLSQRQISAFQRFSVSAFDSKGFCYDPPLLPISAF